MSADRPTPDPEPVPRDDRRRPARPAGPDRSGSSTTPHLEFPTSVLIVGLWPSAWGSAHRPRRWSRPCAAPDTTRCRSCWSRAGSTTPWRRVAGARAARRSRSCNRHRPDRRRNSRTCQPAEGPAAVKDDIQQAIDIEDPIARRRRCPTEKAAALGDRSTRHCGTSCSAPGRTGAAGCGGRATTVARGPGPAAPGRTARGRGRCGGCCGSPRRAAATTSTNSMAWGGGPGPGADGQYKQMYIFRDLSNPRPGTFATDGGHRRSWPGRSSSATSSRDSVRPGREALGLDYIAAGSSGRSSRRSWRASCPGRRSRTATASRRTSKRRCSSRDGAGRPVRARSSSTSGPSAVRRTSSREAGAAFVTGRS